MVRGTLGRAREILCALVLIASLSYSRSAAAYHTEEDRQTDFSADTLQGTQIRLGLFQVDYGLFDSWMVGTYTIPWLLMPFTKSFCGDLYTKWKFLDLGPFAMSARVAFFYLSAKDTQIGGAESADFYATVTPLSLTATGRFTEDWSASLDAAWVQTTARGNIEDLDDASGLGAGAQSNFQLALTSEYRLTRVLALNLVGRVVPFVTTARITSEAQVDDATSATIELDAAVKEAQGGWMIQPGVTFSWKAFNLQFGVGYGNIFVPGLRLVAPVKSVLPDLDLYFRF